MTPNGTLLAYSQPTNINDLRRQAAIAAISWQEHQHLSHNEELRESTRFDIREDSEREPVHVLIMETEESNIIIQRIRNQLLLVLEGGVPPRRAGFVKTVTAESADGTQLQPYQQGGNGSATSKAEPDGHASKAFANVLKLQRKKLNALAEVIIADFEQTGFQMPDEGGSSTVF